MQVYRFKNKESGVRSEEIGEQSSWQEAAGSGQPRGKLGTGGQRSEVGNQRSEDPGCKMQDPGCRGQNFEFGNSNFEMKDWLLFSLRPEP
jgi:hypothetical protein